MSPPAQTKQPSLQNAPLSPKLSRVVRGESRDHRQVLSVCQGRWAPLGEVPLRPGWSPQVGARGTGIMTLDLWIGPSTPIPGVGPLRPGCGLPGAGAVEPRAQASFPHGESTRWTCMFPTKTSPGSAQLPRYTMGTRLRWCRSVLQRATAYGGGGCGSLLLLQVPSSHVRLGL